MKNVILYSVILTIRNDEIRLAKDMSEFFGQVLCVFTKFNDLNVEKVRVGVNYAQIFIWFADDDDIGGVINRMKKSVENFVGPKFRNLNGRASFLDEGYFLKVIGDVDMSQDNWWTKIEMNGLIMENKPENLK